MRLTWLIVVGIATAGCKDKSPSGAAQSADRATAGSATPKTATGATPQPRPETPTLPADQLFAEESEDSQWAGRVEQTLRVSAPKLEGVDCKHTQCRATLAARTESELVDAIEKIPIDTALLMGLDQPPSVKLTQPVQRDGAFAMTFYIRFDRGDE